MASARYSCSGFEDPYESPKKCSPENRIRAILGLPSGSSLPEVSQLTLLEYYHYLSSRLTLPFEASYAIETEPTVYPVTVIGLVDPRKSPPDSAGLLCTAYLRNKTSVLPLVDMEVAVDSPNFPIIEDYWYLIWNWREANSQVTPDRQV